MLIAKFICYSKIGSICIHTRFLWHWFTTCFNIITNLKTYLYLGIIKNGFVVAWLTVSNKVFSCVNTCCVFWSMLLNSMWEITSIVIMHISWWTSNSINPPPSCTFSSQISNLDVIDFVILLTSPYTFPQVTIRH